MVGTSLLISPTQLGAVDFGDLAMFLVDLYFLDEQRQSVLF
jgi:hypothetical protein